MDNVNIPKGFRNLILYYMALQSFHIIFLIRGGLIFLSEGRIPFPAQPPVSGWSAETIPFLLGMGAVDGLAAGLALYAGWKMIKESVLLRSIWTISISIALTSAVIYCFGTIPSGAWQSNPIGYGIVVLAFSPLLVLGTQFIRYWSK